MNSPVETTEGESGSARPGDLTCRQMIAALFSLTPLFEKSSGFNRESPRCFDTVAWIPSPPGLAYGPSMPLFMWDSSQKKDFSLSFFLLLFLFFSASLSTPLLISYFLLSHWKVFLCDRVVWNSRILLLQHFCKVRGNKWKWISTPSSAEIQLKPSLRS